MPTITGRFWNASGTRLAGLLSVRIAGGLPAAYLDQIIAPEALEPVLSTEDVSIAMQSSGNLLPVSLYDLDFYGEYNAIKSARNVTVLDTTNTLDDIF